MLIEKSTHPNALQKDKRYHVFTSSKMLIAYECCETVWPFQTIIYCSDTFFYSPLLLLMFLPFFLLPSFFSSLETGSHEAQDSNSAILEEDDLGFLSSKTPPPKCWNWGYPCLFLHGAEEQTQPHAPALPSQPCLYYLTTVYNY